MVLHHAQQTIRHQEAARGQKVLRKVVLQHLVALCHVKEVELVCVIMRDLVLVEDLSGANVHDSKLRVAHHDLVVSGVEDLRFLRDRQTAKLYVLLQIIVDQEALSVGLANLDYHEVFIHTCHIACSYVLDNFTFHRLDRLLEVIVLRAFNLFSLSFENALRVLVLELAGVGKLEFAFFEVDRSFWHVLDSLHGAIHDVLLAVHYDLAVIDLAVAGKEELLRDCLEQI